MHFRCLLNYIIYIFFHSLYLKQAKKTVGEKETKLRRLYLNLHGNERKVKQANME